MPEYKTAEQARTELEAIRLGLAELYDIKQLDDGVALVRGESSIICRCAKEKSSYGGGEGLYEIFPSVNGQSIKDLFGRSVNVVGWLPLRKAVEIAEAAVEAGENPEKLQALEEALKSD